MNQSRHSAAPLYSGWQCSRSGWLYGALAAGLVVLSPTLPAGAQTVLPPPPTAKCPVVNNDLTLQQHPTTGLPVPREIDSAGGRLKGTVVLTDNQRVLQIAPAKCLPQLQRFFQQQDGTDVATSGPQPQPLSGLPIPGPTLRAQLGDIVQLTFLNQINTLDYGNSVDMSENSPVTPIVVPGAGCDSATNGSGYPKLGTSGVVDSLPNCFHGSTTGNMHFHGTHTSPMGTADNIFLGIRPSPRGEPAAGTGATAPLVTSESVKYEFDAFFSACEQKLKANNLLQWPLTWADLNTVMIPKVAGTPNWTAQQQSMLQAYDATKGQPQQLWPVDDGQIQAGAFPQYYIGSFPYCFALPRYTAKQFPPPPNPGHPVLQMGQSPGTMWYHAHKHGSTAIDVSNGMLGALIIEDNTYVPTDPSQQGYDGAIKAFYKSHPNGRQNSGSNGTTSPILQNVMVVNQVAGTPKLVTRAGTGGGGVPFSINGQQNPVVSMKSGETQLWRIVNGSTISGFYLPALPAGFTWRQTAQDGVQFDDFNYKSRAQRPVFVAAGNRIDLLVHAPTLLGQKQPNFYPVLVNQSVSQSGAQNALVATAPLLIVEVLAESVKNMPLMPDMPKRPVFQTDIKATDITKVSVNGVLAVPKPRPINFQTINPGTGASTQTIAHDGGPQLQFEENGATVNIPQLGSIEEWRISNSTNGGIDHPFHIHINPFQVTEVFDPNAPLLNAQGQVVTTKNSAGATVPVPLYVFSTVAPAPQPILVKGQCLINGADSTTWHPCAQPPNPQASNIWWDVFPIPDATSVPKGAAGAGTVIPGYFKMRTRFVDYKGSYVIHCHILAHEDRGMMLMVDLGVAPGKGMAMMRHN